MERKNLYRLCFLLLFSLFCFSAARCESTEEQAALILEEMTLEEKVEQMIVPFFRSWNSGGRTSDVTALNSDLRSFLKKHSFGGMALVGGNFVSTSQATKLINDIQKTSLTGGAKAQLLIMADQEGGTITRLSAGTQMPGNMALGASGNPRNAERAAAVMGEELAVLGINVDLAPVLDINNNPANPIIGLRSFSDDPKTAADLGLSFIKGLHSAGIISCLKHFPGHGDTDVDSHTGLPKIERSPEELRRKELVPYREAVKTTDMVMTTHIQYPQIEKNTYISKKDGQKVYLPATLSKTIISGILRGELGFEGVVITDALAMDAIEKNFDRTDAAKLAVNAGVDMLLFPVEAVNASQLTLIDSYIDSIIRMVRNGDIPEQRINESVRRILTLKARYGLLTTEVPALSSAALQNSVGSGEHHEAEWEIAKAAVTLVKNENELLPLSGTHKILYACPYTSQYNSFTYAKQKLIAESLWSAQSEVRVFAYSGLDPSAAGGYLGDADVVIAVSAVSGTAGLDPGKAAGKNGAFLDELIRKAHAKGRKVVLISAQLPYDTARFPQADAILACYNANGMPSIPGKSGGNVSQYGPNLPAAVYTVFGGSSPRGKLPVSIPALNSNYTYANTTQYQKGFGLRYSGDEIRGCPVIESHIFRDFRITTARCDNGVIYLRVVRLPSGE